MDSHNLALPQPAGVEFRRETLCRSGSTGDNWCITWAGDGAQYTSMCDGNWLGGEHKYHNHLYRIPGQPEDLRVEDVPGYPQFVQGTGSWFGYGIVSSGGVLYSAISKTPGNRWSGPFRGLKLLASRDGGATWARIDRRGLERVIEPWAEARNEVSADEMFFLEECGHPHREQPAYPFSYVSFVQCGRDNTAARDDYTYIHSPEGAQSHQLLLARAPKHQIGVRDAWEYFVRYDDDGHPMWSPDLRERGPVHLFPERSGDDRYFGWYSWLPSVVWNEPLGLYIMANGGTYAGCGMTSSDEDYYDAWMHERTGSLGFWYAHAPWGPWRQFFYTDYWTVDDAGNRTYQPKLSPKWISDDGRRMVLIWSDAMRNEDGRSHTVNYRWNQMEIELALAEQETGCAAGQ